MTAERPKESGMFRLLRRLGTGQKRGLGQLTKELCVREDELLRIVQEAQMCGVEICIDPLARQLIWQCPFSLYEHSQILAAIRAEALPFLGDLKIFESIDSTNQYVREHGPKVNLHGLCCLAEMQRCGRGRRGKSFQSPLGNIYLSVGWKSTCDPLELGALSLAMGVAVAKSLETVGAEVALKWPNDIVSGSKKMAGILVESERKGHSCTVVVGVGINVTLTPRHSDNDAWTHVAKVVRRPIDRTLLVANLISHVLLSLDLYDRMGFAAFRSQWNARHAMAGKRVRIEEQGKRPVVGVALDVDRQGAFRLDIDGVVQSFVTGASSLRLV